MYSIFDAELWSNLDDLALLQDRDLSRILIKTDSLEAIHASHVPRKVNLVADRIAKTVSVDLKGINVLTITPTNLLEALE
ncbi:hypothetical protein Golob_002967, partial [Gossypium lobatum]|nr:hypothetical protein [Gossypium lobatum]